MIPLLEPSETVRSSGVPLSKPTFSISDGIPRRMKLYWSLRMKIFRSGSGSGCGTTPIDSATAAASPPRSDSSSP